MIKVVIFDFDGVIVESVDIKTEAFRRLFENYPQHVDEIVKFHVNNGGISRQEKIKHFYKNILKQPLTQEKMNELSNRFSELVKEAVIAAPFVAGAQKALNDLKVKYPMYIVSGTPQDEMREIIKRRKLDGYFVEVFGSPDTKTDIVRRILDKEKIRPNETVFVGDSINDLVAAKNNKTPFVGRSHIPDSGWLNDPAVTVRVKDLIGFLDVLKTVEQKTKG